VTVVPFPTPEPSLEECRAYFAEMAALPRLNADTLLTETLDSIRKGGDYICVDEAIADVFLRIGAIADATGGLGCRWTIRDAVDAIEELARSLKVPA
jgi:hypothetical protein